MQTVSKEDKFMKCQIRFSRKNKKNNISLSSAEFAHKVVKLRRILSFLFHIQKSSAYAYKYRNINH